MRAAVCPGGRLLAADLFGEVEDQRVRRRCERVFFLIFLIFFSGFVERAEVEKKKKKALSQFDFSSSPSFYFLNNKTGVKADWPLDGYRYSWRMKDATDGKLTGEIFNFSFPFF